MRSRKIALALLTAIGVPAAAAALADTYPSRPIKVIVPFPAGGPLDLVGRMVTEKMSVSLKQPFVFENKAGAAGNLGTEAAAKAAPDGYTLLLVLGTTLSVNPWLYKKLPFDPVADLRPLSIVTSNSQMLVVHPSRPGEFGRGVRGFRQEGADGLCARRARQSWPSGDGIFSA